MPSVRLGQPEASASQGERIPRSATGAQGVINVERPPRRRARRGPRGRVPPRQSPLSSGGSAGSRVASVACTASSTDGSARRGASTRMYARSWLMAVTRAPLDPAMSAMPGDSCRQEGAFGLGPGRKCRSTGSSRTSFVVQTACAAWCGAGWRPGRCVVSSARGNSRVHDEIPECDRSRHNRRIRRDSNDLSFSPTSQESRKDLPTPPLSALWHGGCKARLQVMDAASDQNGTTRFVEDVRRR